MAPTAIDSNHMITVEAVDYGFVGLPGELDVGSKLMLTNSSTTEVHELVAMRLADGETGAADELLSLPQSELERFLAAPPSLVVVAPPAEWGFVALGDGVLDEPGRYLIACFIPTGADPQTYLDALEAAPGQPPQVDGGPPHFTAGMVQEVVVG